MKSNVIQLNAPSTSLAAPPANVFALRWRISTKSGVSVHSNWTPEVRYPSISETLQEFDGQIQSIFIDGTRLDREEKVTFLRCPGSAFQAISYKMMHSAAAGRTIVAGIEVEDVNGQKYLVLRDGTVFVEGKA